MRRLLFTHLLLAAILPAFARAELTIESGTSRVVFHAQPSGGFGVSIATGATTDFESLAPAALRLSGAGRSLSAISYETVTADGAAVIATVDIATDHGSRFHFIDTWSSDRDGSIKLARQVTVTAADARDRGFDSCVSFSCVDGGGLREHDVFLPGVWYRQNEHVVPKAIGADLKLDYFLVKETRLPLPMAMIRAKNGGASLTILHADARPSTGLNDADTGEQIDASIQYGTIGPCVDDGRVSLNFCYPGSEGERSYGTTGWRWRWHPVRVGFSQSYQLLIRDRPAASNFSTAMTDAWRFAYRIYAPFVRPAASSRIYQDGLRTLARYYRDDFRNGGRGWPFMIFLGLHPAHGNDRRVEPPGGIGPSDYHLQSGFVGQQIGAAYLMLRQSVIDHDAEGQKRWASVIDFWTTQSLSKAGVPRTDYFCERAQWGSGPSFLRTLCDGTEAVLDGYRCLFVHGERRDDWLRYAKHVGDWLLSAQAADGSWARSYRLDGAVDRSAKFNSTNPIRLLVKLSIAAGDAKYLAGAKRAGEWCLKNVDEPSAYVGGTPDNDNTIDKEAGVLAMLGFRSLYDATGEQRWLAASARAADFAETWTFAWSYPVASAAGAIDATRSPWPGCGLIGQSLVATGHSYVDMYMAGCSTAYYRLALQTGDDHYRQFARLLADGANRPADVDGDLHYPMPGLIEEGVRSSEFVANGVGTCLTWCTVAQMRPIADLQDLFNLGDRIEDVDAGATIAQLQASNRRWFRVASGNIRP